MENCKTCGRAIFDALWGEYKCDISKVITYDADFDRMLVGDCDHYKKGTPKESKKNADYEANLSDS